MNKIFATALLAAYFCTASAQVTVSEPEFINSYHILTSDSTTAVLPKESGTIGQHETKAKRTLGLLGKVANVASAAGGLGAIVGANTGSYSGTLAGIKVMTTASSAGDVASTASALASSAGMDVIFKGKSSSYKVDANGEDIRLLIKGENNDEDPMGIYRIVKFNVLGKNRRIQWMEFDSALLGSEETTNGGYLNFVGRKYGEQSYILTIPASEVAEGEYGVFYLDIITAAVIPVGTFSVKK